jgi:hypothetical protein
MQLWLDVRPAVLDEIISLDGPGDVQTDFCGSCLNRKTTPPLYRCLECSYGLLFCGECVVRSHQALPLHRLEVHFICTHHPFITLTPSAVLEGWFFDRVISTFSRICLSSWARRCACPMDHPLTISLSLTLNGWHKLQVRFCACGTSTSQPEHYHQLLRMRWYPASFQPSSNRVHLRPS